jgi:hypothetical protein
MRRSRVLATVAVVAAAGAVGAVALTSGEETAAPPAGPTLWIDTDGGTCARRAAPAPYDSAAACGSLAAAYAAARSGDEVRVREGAYGVQAVEQSNDRLTRAVVVRPADGETVTFASLTTNGDHLTIRDIAIPVGRTPRRGWFNQGSDVLLQNVDISGPEASVYIDGGARVTYRDSDFGTPGNTVNRECGVGNSEPFDVSEARDVLVENVTFHPFIADTGPDCGTDNLMHLETIRIGDDLHDFTISRSRFLRGDGSGTARIFATGAGGRDATGVVIVNSWIGVADGKRGNRANSIHFGAGSGGCDGFVIAYSYWEGALYDTTCPVRPTYIGNLGTMPDYVDCPGSESAANLWVWSAARTGCGTDQWLVDTSGDPLGAYRHDADGFHLTGDSPAIDAGQPLDACEALTGGVDIDGDPRKGACDAGPDEYRPEA